MPYQDLYLYGHYELNTYTISCETNGGTDLEDILYTYGDMLNLKTPMKTGYNFVGWFVDDGFNEPFDVGSNPFEDLVLYAKWEIKNFELNYYTLGDMNYNQGDIVLDEDEYLMSTKFTSNVQMVLTNKGRVFAWGDNTYGQLCDGTSTSTLTPIEITDRFAIAFDDKIIDFDLSPNFAVFLTESGKVFTCEFNIYLQFDENAIPAVVTPRHMTNDFDLHENEKIIDISIGESGAAALTDEGRLFMWGAIRVNTIDDDMAIVIKPNPEDMSSYFNLIEGETFTYVELEGGFYSVITSLNHVYIWGFGNSGYTEVPPQVEVFPAFNPYEDFNLNEGESVDQIMFGSNAMIALTSAHRVFTQGVNHYGQLGDGTTINGDIPIDITSNFGLTEGEYVKDIKGSDHNFAVLTSLNKVFVWGSNEDHQLLVNDIEMISTPYEIELLENQIVDHIEMYGSSIAIISSDGNLWMWGDNRSGIIEENQNTIDNPTQRIFNRLELVETAHYDYQEMISLNGLVKEGYTFNGWYIDKACTQLFDQTQMPNGDLILYGYYTHNNA